MTRDGIACGYGCTLERINTDCPTHYGGNTAMLQQNPDDTTRPRRMALDAAREYYRISREHCAVSTSYPTTDYAIAAALQGILRLMIYQVGGDEYGYPNV